MIRPLSILLCAPLALADPVLPDTDLLRFTNGNQLDGHFGGLTPGGVVTWTRPDVETPMPFQRGKIRQVVLRNARPLATAEDLSSIALVNGDRLPGTVVAADDAEVVMESSALGTLTLPRDTIASISPNPFGGRLIYAGPFDAKDWTIVRADGKSIPGDAARPALEDAEDKQPLLADEEVVQEKEADPTKSSWVHTGASWYSRGGSDAITYDAKLPDRALIRFKAAWRSRPNITIAVHADLDRREPKDDEGRPTGEPISGPHQFARFFGTAYVMTFQPGYAQLQRTSYSAEGIPTYERIRVGGTTARLVESGEAVFEIRCDRSQGTISVLIDGEFAVQWNTFGQGEEGGPLLEPPPAGEEIYRASGSAIGFLTQGGLGAVRISDIVVAEWNGMTDSARSMETDTRDIALLVNGTDRFSGKLAAIRNGIAEINAAYGPLKVPLGDIAEIHFARDERRKGVPPPEVGVSAILQPIGRISGSPLASRDGRLQLRSELVGELDLDLSPVVVLDFQPGSDFLDDWSDAP